MILLRKRTIQLYKKEWGDTVLKLLKHLKVYRWGIALVLLLVFLQSLSDLYLPTLMADIVDTGIVKGDTNYILKIGGFMLLIAALGMICAIWASYASSKIAMGFGNIIRKKVFSQVEGYSLEAFNEIGTASLITRTTNDITQVQQVLVIIMRMMVAAPMMMVGGIIMAASKDVKLTSIFVVILPVLALTIYLIASKGVPLFKKMQVKLDGLNHVTREGLTGIRIIRSFNRMDSEKERFVNANFELTDTALKVNRIMSFMMPALMLILNLSMVAILWFGSHRIDNGGMQVGDLMAFIQYAMQILFSLIMGSMVFVMLPRASASATRIVEVLDLTSKVNDPAKPKEEMNKKGYIEFDNVTFEYPGAEEPVLSNISFTTKPGEITAIVGGTGAGKSTLVNLIPRFYDIQHGSIKVNGVDIKEMSQHTLREKIGFVPQKAVLFTGTVAENIRYGKEDATLDEIKKAAATAQATDFIENMEDGYDSYIAQGGKNVSGGQKQRLSIARALVRNPEIYIFDDSFSALDYKTDSKLRMALQKETTNAAVIIVAQRVSSIRHANQIIVLDEGKMAGIGTHEELLQNCDVYKEIVSSQLSEEESA